jgi:xylulokinase
MKYYLGIDIGTFESKAALVDGEGNIIASASHPHKMLVPQAGWAEHNADEDWWGDFKRLSSQVIRDSKINSKDIRAVAASAIGPCMLPIDGNGDPLMNGVLYGVDTRATKEIEYLNDKLGVDTILAQTGNSLTSQSVGPKILWLKNQRPDLYAKTAKFVTSTTFINQKLTGRCFIDHYSAANWGPLYLPDEEGWSDRLNPGICRLDQLAEIAWTTDIIGEVTKHAASETGIAAGTPVIAGTIDAASEAISVGVLNSGDMMVMYGSTIFIILVTKSRVDDARLWYAPWLFKGQHASMSGLATSGTLTHWFRQNFGKELAEKDAAIALANEASTSPPGANGIVVLPYFSGERTPRHDPQAKGMIYGLDLTHSRADIYRAFLESIAFGTKHIFDTYAETNQTPRHIESVGGGTKNSVWLQATSDVTGFVQSIREKTSGASFGNAFLAALSVGDVQHDEINMWNKAQRQCLPKLENQQVYAENYRKFLQLYERNRDLMHGQVL